MMVSNEGSLYNLLRWQQPRTRLYLLAGAGVWFVHDLLGMQFLALPVVPVTVIGAAIGIFASFRTNSAYDRWWEGRKLWGRMINSSRHWGNQVKAYVEPVDADLARHLTHRHIAYVHILRCLLRTQPPLVDAQVTAFLTDAEKEELASSTNMTNSLLRHQTRDLAALADSGKLDAFRLQSFDGTLMDLLNIQGGCERIKGTPLPRGYGYIVDVLIQMFAFIFPLAVVPEASLYVIPLNLVVCMAFNLISEAGRVLEDPFTMFWNGLPLHALSTKIERDLRQGLGETDLPDAHVPDHQGILM